MYTFLVVYTKNMYFYFILILYIYINRWREGNPSDFQKESFWTAKRVLLQS